MQPAATAAPVAPPAPFTEKKYVPTLIFVTSLFMLWAIAITMGDVLNKHFQNVLSVSKAQSSLVQFSIFGAYAVMGIPAGLFMKRFGYKRGVLLGLGLYAAGAFLFVPAANAACPPLVASAMLGQPGLYGPRHEGCSPVKTMSGISDRRRWCLVRHVSLGGVVTGHLHAS